MPSNPNLLSQPIKDWCEIIRRILKQFLYCCWFLCLWSRQCTIVGVGHAPNWIKKQHFSSSSILSSYHHFTFPYMNNIQTNVLAMAILNSRCKKMNEALHYFPAMIQVINTCPSMYFEWIVAWISVHKVSLQLISNNQQWMRICWGACIHMKFNCHKLHWNSWHEPLQ